MTQKHYSFPSIEQFRTVIKYVTDRVERIDRLAKKPTLIFHGTVKLHGTNASVVVGDNTYYPQSRSNVLTLEADNAGFAAWAFTSSVRESMQKLAAQALRQYFGTRDYVDSFEATPVIYGEWCGGNIQKGVALNKLPKMFVVFAIKLIKNAETGEGIWLMPWDVELAYDAAMATGLDGSVKCVEKFQTWRIEIDMNDPKASQNQLVEITNQVEARCPVSFALGADGVGEGVVWTAVGTAGFYDGPQIRTDDLVFKVKGAKHSDTKTTQTANVDIERVASIKALAEAFCTDHRLEKGIANLQETLGVENVLDVANIGAFLKWVGNDILKEETDTIIGNGFEPREVTKAANVIARTWFLRAIEG